MDFALPMTVGFKSRRKTSKTLSGDLLTFTAPTLGVIACLPPKGEIDSDRKSLNGWINQSHRIRDASVGVSVRLKAPIQRSSKLILIITFGAKPFLGGSRHSAIEFLQSSLSVGSNHEPFDTFSPNKIK